jgi:hypothetical protein
LLLSFQSPVFLCCQPESQSECSLIVCQVSIKVFYERIKFGGSKLFSVNQIDYLAEQFDTSHIYHAVLSSASLIYRSAILM